MYDKIEKIGQSLLQHGPYNDRVYLMKLAPKDKHTIMGKLDDMAMHHDYSKIFCKVPGWAAFPQEHYQQEAHIPRFYNGNEGAHFLAKYNDPARQKITPDNKQKMADILNIARLKEKKKNRDLAPCFAIRELDTHDVLSLTELYAAVFKTYPFPIFEPAFIKKTMGQNVRYFGVFNEGQLVAASSAEMDKQGQNVEMTDFATLRAFSGNGLASHLLRMMEKEMKKEGMITAYTIARALSPGMNVTFSKNGYQFGGVLINNTNIFNGLESMNVWYKYL